MARTQRRDGGMKKRSDEFTFEIPNWSRYNPRNDYKSMPWVRLQTDLFDDASIGKLSTHSQLLYVYLLTVMGKALAPQATCMVRLCAAKTNSRADRVIASAIELEQNQLIKITSRSWSDRDTFATKRNETNERNETERFQDHLTNSSNGEKLVSESSQNLPKKITKSKSEPAKSALTWECYSRAYRKRYGVDPIRNRTINSQLKNFVERIGEQEAPEVAAYYVMLNDPFYSKAGHSVGILLRDAEKLRTMCLTGRRTTAIDPKTAFYQEQIEAIERGEV